jgi:hypothetical protein
MPNPSFTERIKNAWNAFQLLDKPYVPDDGVSGSGYSYAASSSYRTDRKRLRFGNDRSIVASIYNRIAIDVSQIGLKHVRVDQDGNYKEDIPSCLNECLTVSANLDQTGRELIMDAVLSMFDEGHVALVPVDTSVDITSNITFDIESIRAGKVTEWQPNAVKVDLYNERTGKHEEILLPKNKVCLVENPFYNVMNEQNSVAKRLIHKLNLLDDIDNNNGSNRLDIIIQLPYTVKSEARQAQANERRRKIEEQLENSKLGIAYIDGTERIVQLNRPAETNLMSQIEYLTNLLYGQLGVPRSVFEGTADELANLNYQHNTLEPVLSALALEMQRKFLTKTARTQGQAIRWFVDPFKLASLGQIADLATKFTSAEILTSNEVRGKLGFAPKDDARADALLNKNINKVGEETQLSSAQDGLSDGRTDDMQNIQNGNNEGGL